MYPYVVDDINNATYRAQPCVRMGAKRRPSKVAYRRCDIGADDVDETRGSGKFNLYFYVTCNHLTLI
jgi:hypothetical protein